MQSLQRFNVQELEKRLGRQLNDEDVDRFKNELEKTAKSCGEAVSQEESKGLEDLLNMAKKKYAMGEEQWETIYNNFLASYKPKEKKEEQNTTFPVLKAISIFVGASGMSMGLYGATYFGLNLIYPHTESYTEKPSIYTFKGEVIAESEKVHMKDLAATEYNEGVEGLKEYKIKYRFNDDKFIIIRSFGDTSKIKCINDAIHPADNVEITTKSNLDFYAKSKFDFYTLKEIDILKVNGKPLSCWID